MNWAWVKKYAGVFIFIMTTLIFWSFWGFDTSQPKLSKVAGCNLFVFWVWAGFQFLKQDFYQYILKKPIRQWFWLSQFAIVSGASAMVFKIIVFLTEG